jgi:hypothetical protein
MLIDFGLKAGHLIKYARNDRSMRLKCFAWGTWSETRAYWSRSGRWVLTSAFQKKHVNIVSVCLFVARFCTIKINSYFRFVSPITFLIIIAEKAQFSSTTSCIRPGVTWRCCKMTYEHMHCHLVNHHKKNWFWFLHARCQLLPWKDWAVAPPGRNKLHSSQKEILGAQFIIRVKVKSKS